MNISTISTNLPSNIRQWGEKIPLQALAIPVGFLLLLGMLILPMPDVFGWQDRINAPDTVGTADVAGRVRAANWTWRLPWPSDRLPVEAVAPAARLRTWSIRHGG